MILLLSSAFKCLSARLMLQNVHNQFPPNFSKTCVWVKEQDQKNKKKRSSSENKPGVKLSTTGVEHCRPSHKQKTPCDIINLVRVQITEHQNKLEHLFFFFVEHTTSARFRSLWFVFRFFFFYIEHFIKDIFSWHQSDSLCLLVKVW